MTRIGVGRGRSVGMALSAAGAMWLFGCAGQAAMAGDDGAAPIWTSLGSVLDFGGDKVQPTINYRDHPRLVVPRNMDLPPPAVAPSAGVSDWPRDPDVENFKKAKAEETRPVIRNDPPRSRSASDVKVTPDTVVTTNYTAGMGPSTRGKCVAGPGQTCDTPPSPSLNWNPLTWVGIQKKPVTVLGPEPARESLIDPPPGYRDPAEGVGAKVEN